MGDISKERPQKIYRTHLLTTYCCCSDKRLEPSIAAARASVMVYDDINKKWIPAGASHGLSKVSPSLFNNLTNSERGLRHNPKFLLKCSVADLGFFYPGSGSRVKKVPDPGSWSASKNWSIFNPKNCFKSFGKFIWDIYPGSRFFPSLIEGSKSTGSQIRIR